MSEVGTKCVTATTAGSTLEESSSLLYLTPIPPTSTHLLPVPQPYPLTHLHPHHHLAPDALRRYGRFIRPPPRLGLYWRWLGRSTPTPLLQVLDSFGVTPPPGEHWRTLHQHGKTLAYLVWGIGCSGSQLSSTKTPRLILQ